MMEEKYVPNPLYLFSKLEEGLLSQLHVSDEYCHAHKLGIFSVPLDPGKNDRAEVKEFIRLMSEGRERIVITGHIRTTLKIPHHIHEDGSMEEQPGRKGPFRTYFDGSSISQLGHAIAVCVDRPSGTITTQCPKGYELNELSAKLLSDVFKGYSHQTVSHRQQHDQHSCGFITLRNVFGFAGVMPPVQDFDVQAWRDRMIITLEIFEELVQKKPDSSFKKAFDEQRAKREARYKGRMPVFEQRSIPAPGYEIGKIS